MRFNNNLTNNNNFQYYQLVHIDNTCHDSHIIMPTLAGSPNTNGQGAFYTQSHYLSAKLYFH